MSSYPDIFRVRQKLSRPRIDDIPRAVKDELASLQLHETIRAGQSVAITAGSRGIANIPAILRAIVDFLSQLGARPFVVPAMGSHGGGAAAGQLRVLQSLGVTESACGCPIRAGMETVVLCETAEGYDVHFDRIAHQADHVLVCGRVKPHTAFSGRIESGLMKMLLIGLGNHEGATTYHRAAITHGFRFDPIVESAGRDVFKRGNIVGGLAIVENGYDETARLVAALPEAFERTDAELLVVAREWMPRLPFRRADVLIIDEIGKNISGSGMDTNVIGRKAYDHQAAEDEWPKVARIIVRSLTQASDGNATGIGRAEFCRARVIEQTDRAATWVNCQTSGRPTLAMIPMHFDTDRELLDVALASIGLTRPENVRLLWIHNTLDLAEVECSAAYLDEAREHNGLEILTGPRPLPLDASGNLPDWSS